MADQPARRPGTRQGRLIAAICGTVAAAAVFIVACVNITSGDVIAAVVVHHDNTHTPSSQRAWTLTITEDDVIVTVDNQGTTVADNRAPTGNLLTEHHQLLRNLAELGTQGDNCDHGTRLDYTVIYEHGTRRGTISGCDPASRALLTDTLEHLEPFTSSVNITELVNSTRP